MKKKSNNIIKFILSTVVSCLLLVGCANEAATNKVNNVAKDTTRESGEGYERVDFDELIKNLKITPNTNFNDSVLVTSAISNANLLNQKVNVIVEMNDNALVESYLNLNNGVEFNDYYCSKRAIEADNANVSLQAKLAKKLLDEGLIDSVIGNYNVLMNGICATTTYGRVNAIKSIAGVKEAYVSTVYNEPKVVRNETNVDEKTGIYTNDTEYDGSNTIVAVLDSGFDYSHEVFNMTIDTPALTKDDVSNVLESTMAYSIDNSLTINDVYISSKIPFAYDYADKKPDVYPVESDHGTHVSGVIGGKSDVITGIAPNTQFAWMKVFSDDESGGDSIDILCALEDSVILGVDAINMSLGTVGGYSKEVPTQEIDNLAERTNKIYDDIERIGISLVTACGNEYSSGYQSSLGTNSINNPESGSIGSPGSYGASLAIASINGIQDPYALINGSDTDAVFFDNPFDSKQNEHKFIEELFAKVKTLELPRNPDGSIDIEYVTVPGYGLKVNYAGTDVKGKIALVKRGNITFEEKMRYAYQAGALAVLIYNNVSGTLGINIGETAFIPSALISMDSGEKLAKTKNGTLNFNESYVAGPFMSDFSSWGPLPDLTLKPEITAHGGNIYSSILGGRYDSMSGTSMASPNACGIILVIRDYVKEKWPSLSAKEVTQMVNRLLMSTANICLDQVGNPYSPRKQGAGLASLLNSVSTNAFIYVDGKSMTKIELGDDKNRTGIYTATFNVSNFADHDISYDIGNFTFTESVSSDGKAVAEAAYMLSPTMDVEVGESLTLDGNKVLVPAGTDDTITVTLNLSSNDRNYLEKNFVNGMYVEGFITLDALDDAEVDLNVPFLSFYGSWLEAPLFDVDFYDVEKDRVDGSISEDDKLKADMTANTPFARYEEYYVVPLGSYLYDIPEGYELIPALEDKAAISLSAEDGLYQFYSIWAGLLRGAKKLTMTITDDVTGKVVYEKVTYNNRKATYYGSYGGAMPYDGQYDFSIWDDQSGIIYANNTKFNVKLVGELDYEDGDKVSNNTFECSFYADYESPSIVGATYETKYNKTTKENEYYINLSTYDNRYTQCVFPATVVGEELVTLTDQPIPVYQEKAGQTTQVQINVTDFIPQLKETEYPNTLFFVIYDYAMNTNVYYVSLSGTDNTDLAFNDKTITVAKNETINLNEYVNVENATLQNLTWSSSNEAVAIVDDAQVIGLQRGIATITGISKEFNISINVRIKVDDGTSSTPDMSLSDISFSGYDVLFSFDDDSEQPTIGLKDAFYVMPPGNSFDVYPSESFKLHVATKPWNFDDSQLKIVYSSSDSEYVSVDENGIVTPLKETITPVYIKASAYVNDVETVFSATAIVSVRDPFVTSGIILQSYRGFGGDIVIPDDLGIQYIGEFAFSHYLYSGYDKNHYAVKSPLGNVYSSPITSVTIPNGVKFIQGYAFYGQDSLKSVSLPFSCGDIYTSAFENCSSLESINLNYVNKIEANAFKNDTNLTNVNGQNSKHGNDLSNIITMGNEAFANSGITKANLSNLRMAGNKLFANCSNLSDVTLYDLTPLTSKMFDNSGIEDISIPHDLIPDSAFSNCHLLENVTFTNNDLTIGEKAFANCENLSSVLFASGSTNLNIGYNAFENSAVTNLVLPSCNVTINDEAFLDGKLTSLTLNENTLLDLNGTPFAENENFASVILNNSNNYVLEENLLLSKDKSTLVLAPNDILVSIPGSVTKIGNSSLASNSRTTSLLVPSSIISIGNYAFAESALETIDILDINNKELGSYLLYGCKNLTAVSNLNDLLNIPDYMFAKSGLTSATIGTNVNIGKSAFANTTNLGRLSIGSGSTIGEYAFTGAFSKEGRATISGGTIGNYAFANSNLKSLTLNNVEHIGQSAFYKNNGLEQITINSLEVSDYAFANIESLTSVILNGTTSIGNYAFANDINLVSVTGSDIEHIGNHAFENANLLKTIDLSNVSYIGEYGLSATGITSANLNSITQMGIGAFFDAKSLKEVTLSNKLENIPDNAFSCQITDDGQAPSVLETINLENVKSIGSYAFYFDSALTNVNLSNVEFVGEFAFYETNLKSLSLDNAKIVDSYAFYSCPIAGTLNIPVIEYIGNYAFAANEASTIDLPDCLAYIGEGCFASSGKLEQFTHNGSNNYQGTYLLISDGVLYNYLENGNLQLSCYPANNKSESYTIMDGTYRIAPYAFYNDAYYAYLNSITLPSSVQYIGDCAFGGQDLLKEVHFKSYVAPTLESIYNIGVINTLYALNEDQLTNKLNSLYRLKGGPVYNMYFYYYPFYYGNFVNFIGFVEEELTMYYPANGVGYDSFIYAHYFDKIVKDLPVADEATTKAIIAINELANIEKASQDNLMQIKEAYNAYSIITSEEQLSLFDKDLVSHLIDLYAMVVEIETPSLKADEIEAIKGSYSGLDDENTEFVLTINDDGTGLFKVDNKTNDNQDKDFAFDVLRHSKNGGYQFTPNGTSTTFTFVVNEDKTITLTYYISKVTLSVGNNNDKPNNKKGCKGEFAGSIVGILALGSLVKLLKNKKDN